MENDRTEHGHPRSTAQVGGHPIHPMLVPFPIVCFIGTFLADVIYVQSGDSGWASASYWLLGIGLATAALAATAGVIDYLGDDRIRRLGDALKHMLANVTAVVIEAVNLALRIDNRDFIASTGVWLSGLVVLILLYSGWKGGELVYKHGVGVNDGPGAGR